MKDAPSDGDSNRNTPPEAAAGTIHLVPETDDLKIQIEDFKSSDWMTRAAESGGRTGVPVGRKKGNLFI